MESKDGKEDKNVNALLSLPDSTKTLGKKSKSREVNPSGLKRKVSQDTRRMPQKDKPAISGASPKTAGHKNGKESFCGPEEKYALAFKYSPIGICISSLQDGRYVEVNEVYSNFLGYRREELIGRTSSEINLWVDMAERDALVRELLEKGTVTDFQLRFRDRNGNVHWGNVAAALVTIGQELYVLTQTQDVTDKKKIKEQFEKSEAKYRLLAENLTDVIFTIDMNFNYTYASPSTYHLLGYTAEELMTMKVENLVDPETLAWFMEMLAEEMEIEKRPDRDLKRSRVLEYQHIRKDGSTIWVENKITFLRDQDNNAIGIIGTVRDIAERKQAQEKLHRERQLIKSVMEQSTDIIIIVDVRGRIIYENPAVEKILGYRVEERLGASGYDLMHPDDAQIVADAAGKLFHNIQAPVQKGEIRLHHKNGSWRTFEVTASNLVKDHVVEAAIVNMHDITARKRSEELIRQSEAKYRLLADNMKDYVWLMDLNLKINYISPSVERLMGYSLEDFKKFSLDKFLTVQSFQAAMDFFAIEMPKALGAPPDYVLERSLELEFCCKNGQTVWGECNFSLIRDDKGKPLSLLGVSRNINERKQMEDALRKSEENFRHSLDDSPLGVRISTVEGKTLYANRAILDMYGYDSKEELQNTPLQERYTPETFEAFKERKKKRLKGQFGPSEYEISIIRKDGEIRHLHVFRKEIFWNGQKQSQVIYEDITLRRRAENRLNETLESLRQSIKITIQVLGTASEAKDPYMAGHQRRVADLARAIATEMKLPQDKIEAIRMASAIHDIGKISVPAEILCKPAILSDIEFSFVKNHPRYSYDIMKEVESPWPLADIVYQHHERMDGSGYPLGLKNDEILIESRILAVADVVEAMISYRPYRPALALEMALAEIEDNAGTLYDAEVVKACLRLFRDKNYQMS